MTKSTKSTEKTPSPPVKKTASKKAASTPAPPVTAVIEEVQPVVEETSIEKTLADDFSEFLSKM